MNLLIDIGNSRLKWALYVRGEFVAQGVATHASADPATLFGSEWRNCPPPRAVWVSNVAGGLLARALADWSVRAWNVAPKFVEVERQAFGVTNAYHDPRQLGVDRWVALIAARRHTAQPACVIDCGTAITIDVLADSGEHQGGVILPGFRAMRAALARDTRAVRVGDDDGAPLLKLGRSTHEGVTAGCAYAVIGAIEHVVADARTRLGPRLKCLLTGGAGAIVQSLFSQESELVDNLVLRGLSIIADART